MELESPLGYSCKKPFYGEGSNGTLQIIEDYCETWSDTGIEGTTPGFLAVHSKNPKE